MEICRKQEQFRRIMPLLLLLAWSSLIASCNFVQVADALKVTVSIPNLVKLNDPFWLNCTNKHTANDQQSEHPLNENNNNNNNNNNNENNKPDIYAIKWYKDEEEFYRYLPNAQPKTSIYETNGIQLDQTKSHEGNVFISKADVHSEGTYRCEILSESPLFETVRKSKHLKVYALPIRGPRIEILDSNGKPKSPKAQEISYAVGDKIELRCNSAPSKPAARLRWYLNDHELTIPASNSSKEQQNGQIRLPSALGYDVRVTPIEYRQHYKSIYSSHSTLNLLLQQDDLINNKISFKCLASMRQEVPIRSKQLILMTSQTSAKPSSSVSSRIRRSSEFVSNSNGDGAHVHQRQRPQNHRHTVSRLSAPKLQQSQVQQKASLLSNPDLINSLESANNNHMLYIYEDADSTLGQTIIDTPESLASYLRKQANESENLIAGSTQLNNNYNSPPLEFNRADNLEYIQLLRDRLARQRSYPGSNPPQTNNLKRSHGLSSLVKSPLYLDEYDPLRPIISWPPLDSGKLMLLPSGQTIVAIPTPSLQHGPGSQRRTPSFVLSPSINDQKFISPSRLDADSYNTFRTTIDPLDGDSQITSLILEKLLQNLNCTCTDGSIDTKLAWIVSDVPLETRDTRFYPTRVSADHKQTWLTIGFQSANLINHHPVTPNGVIDSPSSRFNPSVTTPSSLQTILGQYLKNPQQSITNNQIKFACRAIHSMLLYSSSEMITFDFNPPPPSVDGNSIDKFASLPNNVIQATSGKFSSFDLSKRAQNCLHCTHKIARTLYNNGFSADV